MSNFFSENGPEEEVFLNAAKTAAEGLVYISETDAEIVPFIGPTADYVTAAVILQFAGRAMGTRVEEKSIDEFFTRLTEPKPWHGEREIERTKKFLKLQKLLYENLGGFKIFRVGQNPIDIFIVGRLRNGRLAGVTTKAVET
jgi:hypothetical protein